MKTTLTIPGRLEGLNGSKGLIRDNRWNRKKKKNSYQWLFLSQTTNRHTAEVKLTLTRYGKREMDYDNLVATGKIPIDALVSAGIIADDNSKSIIERHYLFVKIRMSDSDKTIIEIEDL